MISPIGLKLPNFERGKVKVASNGPQNSWRLELNRSVHNAYWYVVVGLTVGSAVFLGGNFIVPDETASGGGEHSHIRSD